MAKKKQKKPMGPSPPPLQGASSDPGDLRNVAQFMKLIREGSEEAEQAVFMLGRDAAWLVQQAADETNDDKLKALAKKIIAVPPQVKTNLYELRRDSVKALLRSAIESAPQVADLEEITIPGCTVALFDPERLIDALAKGGRPRKDIERIRTGDIAWFGVDTLGPVKLHIVRSPPSNSQPVLDLRLRVTSGVVFVGPPESADGPRLGELRLDPFSTQLHQRVHEGRMVRMKPGRYIVAAHKLDAGEIQLYVVPAPEAEPPLPLTDLTPLSVLPALSVLPSA